MRLAFALGALLPLALLAGCKKAPSVVGKWTGQLPVSGQSQAANFEFSEDKKATFGVKQASVDLSISGDYKLEGEKLTITFTKVDLKGVTKEMKDLVEKGMSQGLNKPQSFDVKFASDDEIAITSQATTGGEKSPLTAGASGKTITLKRVKEGA